MIDVVPCSRALRDEVVELILAIQRDEFGFDIRAEDQPDLLDIEDFYQSGAGGFWVALAGKELVGTIGLRDIGDNQGALRKMFVKAAYRGREHEVALRLLRTLLEAARSGGLEEIYLGTTEKFLAAHRFYEKHGFVRVAANDLPASFPRMALDTRFYRQRVARMPGFDLTPIGHVSSPLTARAQAPKQGNEGSPEAWLIFRPQFQAALADLRPGEEILVLTWLDRADRQTLSVHPRDDETVPLTGVFSTRSQDRPNPVGLHRVKIVEIASPVRIRVLDLEAFDGTPVIDVKPVLDRVKER